MSKKQNSVPIEVPNLEVPTTISSIQDESLRNSIQNLYKATMTDRGMIRNRVIDDFVKLLVQPNDGVIDILKFEKDRLLEQEKNKSNKSKVGEADLKDFEERAKKAVNALVSKGASRSIFDPLLQYVKDGQNEVHHLLSSNDNAHTAVADLFLKQKALAQLPAFEIIVTTEYANRGGMLKAGDTRMMDRNEINEFVYELYPLVNFPVYNIENVLKQQRSMDQDITPLIQNRMKEFFADPHPSNTLLYKFNNNKFEVNKKEFARAVEGDLAVYEVGLEYIAQLQKKNSGQIINDTRRKEILNTLSITMDRNDAINLAQFGGDLPKSLLDKMNSTVAGYDILLSSMKEVGGNRKYPAKEKLIAKLLPQLAVIDSKSLEASRKVITQLCTKAINQYSSKSVRIFGNNTVNFKSEALGKISEDLKTTLKQFPKNSRQNNNVAKNTSEDLKTQAITETSISKTVVSARGKTTSQSENSANYVSDKVASRPIPSKKRKEQPKVVTAASLKRWEESVSSSNNTHSNDQHAANQTIISTNKNSELGSRFKAELEQWEKNYRKGRNLPKGPDKDPNINKSVQNWRYWYEDNYKLLQDKKFVIPANYNDVHEIVMKTKNFGSTLKHMAALQHEIQAKRKAQLKSAPSHLMAESSVREHDKLNPPALNSSKVSNILNTNREKIER